MNTPPAEPLPETLEVPAGALDDTPITVPADVEAPQSMALAVVESPHNVAIGPIAPSDMNPVDAYLCRLGTPAARETAVYALKRALRALGLPPERWRAIRWAALGPAKSRLLYRRVVDGYKPATSRVTLAVVRGVLRQARALGQLGADRYEAVAGTDAWPPDRRESAPTGRMLAASEIAKLRGYCDGLPTLKGVMVWAILAIAVEAGLRRFEIADLRADALSDDSRHVLVMGKGRKEKVHPVSAAVGGALEEWLAYREEAGITSERMFIPLTPRGEPRKGEINKYAVWRIIRAACRGAGCAPFTPHDLRRTYGSTILGQRDLGTTQKLMRHKDPKTTLRYDRRSEKEAEQAAGEIGILERIKT